MSAHAAHMRAAIEEALQAVGPCHPNPAVGAVVVHHGEIAARGHTQPPGGAHAEVQALRQFFRRGHRVDASTALYVTLEPCSTHGRTPPCVDFVLEHGVRKVIAGATDPNPRHAGRGFELLRAAGVEVETGLLAEQCGALNPVFSYWMQTGRSLFAGKIATTIDGRIATRTGHSRWITSVAAREDVARWRRRFPAIAVGAGTVLHDDPRLTSRPPGMLEWCPRRLVFDRSGLCLEAVSRAVFSDAFADRTIYVTSPGFLKRVPAAWRNRGVEVWGIADWEDVRHRCLEAQISGVYIEGGRHVLSDILRARQLDYLFAYRAPLWLGDRDAPGPFEGFAPEELGAAFRLDEPRHAILGPDQLVHGKIVYPPEAMGG